MNLSAPFKGLSRFRWVVLAFIAYGLLTGALLIWQLSETSPAKWCAIASMDPKSPNEGCYNVLLKLLDIKDHTIIGLLLILGVTAAAVVVVTLKVRLDAEGPGGLKVNINQDKTTVTDAEGTSEVEVPTPPSEQNA